MDCPRCGSKMKFQNVSGWDCERWSCTAPKKRFCPGDIEPDIPTYPEKWRDDMLEALETMVEMVEMNGFGKAYAMDLAKTAIAQASRKGNPKDEL